MKILFVITGLSFGGAQNSLVHLLNSIDTERYQVDLLLFTERKELVGQIKTPYRLINPQGIGKDFFLPLKQVVSRAVKSRRPGIVLKRIMIPLKIRLNRRKKYPEQCIWESIGKNIDPIKEHYDVAIAYCQGLPTYFVVDKVDAACKVAWMHSDATQQIHDRGYTLSYYKHFERIHCVSRQAVDKFISVYPELEMVTMPFYNIIDHEEIQNKAMMVVDDIQRNEDELLLCTVGRLHKAKGYDNAIDACAILKEKGIHVRWIVIGEGDERGKLQEHIEKCGLQGEFLLLGSRMNPYPYVNLCDIYVQTSLWEGFCITLAEAKVLAKPIVTTAFTGAEEQINNGVNGLICDAGAQEIADAILRLYKSQNQMRDFTAFLRAEKNNRKKIRSMRW